MGQTSMLAGELGCDPRTLRRAISQGTVRGHRPGPRRLRLSAGEREYLRLHWPLLSSLRRTLRTRREVRLAVLYGSVARGVEDEDSDLDLMVSLAKSSRVGYGLVSSLESVARRRVDIADLERLEANAPLLLDRILDEGRVLVDRDGQWRDLRSRRRAIRRRADRAFQHQLTAASTAIAEITR